MSSLPFAYYLGPEGTFSSIAAKQSVDTTKYQLVACKSWAAIWEALETTQHSVAVVPIENSITSNVHANIDVLFETKFTILAELFVNIRLGLFVKKGVTLPDVLSVYSHPQALMQAKKLISSHNWEAHESLSTSHALEVVKSSKNSTIAALAPLPSRSKHLLDCVLENAQDSDSNQTRFVTVSASMLTDQTGTKASILVETAHEVGSLSRVLQYFTDQNINMTKIESRPIPGKTWSYQFWIDIQMSEEVNEAQLRQTIMNSNSVESLTILGIYSPGITI